MTRFIESRSFVTPSDAAPKTSSDIYISEDAIENAKVVSRDARPKNSVREPISQNRPRSIFQHKSTREISNRINSAGYTNHTGVVSDVQNGAGVNSPNTKNQPQKTKVAASPVVDKVLHTVKPKEEKGSTGLVALDKVQPNPDQPRTNFKRPSFTSASMGASNSSVALEYNGAW